MTKPLFTIFTATYNRAHTLPKLHRSLCSQICKDFEWLIVDDGSTDNTQELVEKWKKSTDKSFQIIYRKKVNGGKPRAINDGIQIANGKYFIIVDSDDYLIDNAIAKMSEWIKDVEEKPDFIGIGAAKGHSATEYIKGKAPNVNEKGYIDCTNLERSKYNLDADMVEAYKTDVFKMFPMAEWPGEKFAPEQIALNEIAIAGYKIRWHRDIVEICEYLSDGLTKGSFNLEKSNPMGYAMMYNHSLKYPIKLKQKLKNSCQHIALSIVGKHPEYILQSNRRLLMLLTLPAGVILSIRRKIQFRGEEK